MTTVLALDVLGAQTVPAAGVEVAGCSGLEAAKHVPCVGTVVLGGSHGCLHAQSRYGLRLFTSHLLTGW
jgi:hypothetical protein